MVLKSSGLIRLISVALAVIIVVGVFFIPIFDEESIEMSAGPDEAEQRFFTLERYEVRQEKKITKKAAGKQRQSVTQTETVKDIPKTEEVSDNNNEEVPAQTETAETVTETEHSDNESGKAESERPAVLSVGKKSKRKIIEYKPDFTTDKLPVYPMSARRLGQQGTVGVTAYVDGNGRLVNVLATRSSGVKSLDDAAVAAVRCWSFDRLHLTDNMNIVKTEIIFRLE